MLGHRAKSQDPSFNCNIKSIFDYTRASTNWGEIDSALDEKERRVKRQKTNEAVISQDISKPNKKSGKVTKRSVNKSPAVLSSISRQYTAIEKIGNSTRTTKSLLKHVSDIIKLPSESRPHHLRIRQGVTGGVGQDYETPLCCKVKNKKTVLWLPEDMNELEKEKDLSRVSGFDNAALVRCYHDICWYVL